MSYSIGDGMVTLALAGGIIGYLYLKHQSRQKRIEIIHQERLAAMEKGIPLPEFPLAWFYLALSSRKVASGRWLYTQQAAQ